MLKDRLLLLLCLLLFAALVAVIMGALFIARPPGQPPPGFGYHNVIQPLEYPYMIKEGKLPGVTWADDIHPIFIRNGCGACHTRGKEAIVEGLAEFALGVLDSRIPSNPYYSYHELVYPEGPPQIQEGEKLRDGQCCWPKNFTPKQQRRIWLGQAEQSAIIHKLDRDYYDWNKSPRFLEEGLRLLWGMPMPMYHEKEGHSEGVPGGMEHEEEHRHDRGRKVHGSVKNEHEYEVRSFFKRVLFHITLWFGANRDKLYALPPRIPTKDRALLRYWISNSLQLMEEGTAIEVQVFDEQGGPVKDSMVHLTGNFNSPERAQVMDVIHVETDVQGKAALRFPEWSVITSFWFVSAEVNGKRTGYRFLRVIPGRINKMDITL